MAPTVKVIPINSVLGEGAGTDKRKKHSPNQTTGGVHRKLTRNISDTPIRLPNRFQSVGRESTGVLHHLSAQLADGNKRKRGQKKVTGAEDRPLDPGPEWPLAAHAELFSKRNCRKAVDDCGKPKRKEYKKAKLPDKKQRS